MHRCVSLLLCASALVLCISGAPLKADGSLDQKLESARLRPSAVDAPLEEMDKVADMDTESQEEEADSVERAYYPSYAPSYSAPYGGGYGSPYSAPYGGGYGSPYSAPYGGGYGYPSQGSSQGSSQGGFQSPYQAPYMPPNNANEVTNPAFHATTATSAAQKMSSQGNGNSYGTIAADSYDPYHPTPSYTAPAYRRRRAAELEAAADQVAEKLAKIVEAEAMKADAEGALDEVDEKVERDFGYGGPYQPAPYGSNYYPAPSYGNYYPAPAPYGNSYQAPYAAPYGNNYAPSNYGGNSYQAPAGPDSARIEQAAASTKSLYMSGGTSSNRPAPYSAQPQSPPSP